MSVKELATNPKIATVVSAATTGTGVSTFLDWLPRGDIAKIATMVGIVLSLVLIYTHLRKGRAEVRKLRLETEILMHDLEVRQQLDRQPGAYEKRENIIELKTSSQKE